MIHYVDTSAALKLLVEEAESGELAAVLDAAAHAGDRLVASMLLFTELHCAARRRGTGIPISSATTVLDGLLLVDVERSDLVAAATSEWGLRSADSIHLATALRIEADTMVTYDAELQAAAARTGLTVVAPESR
ncbi:type II toxin-antitoxin system VapC family toxin [Ornithinibacter sp.]|uniref:type II toxin-antitoxin system VapC family toxin n=1 Tax=Ornithinibacter sp. TaxID=2862748 RepID=UPI001B6716B8|nr:type II toxin-antitoxin system VapC family toxin [Ornithinibacter sp.]MBP6525529.1 type II toxin-antitoxin system VapC family toxin [Dermatophilaceae bacterium]MBU9944071.1 type II toxin-antitoxin system VapC family toxin [Dermatophilaceae bacterium]HQX87982.1 type II toxin-antitoxin system VapC family toxin [Ornithinibacter sp.]HRA27308.1 type II toxin-antitoxin system VapC family toxin [Ornithinibacter sp.]